MIVRWLKLSLLGWALTGAVAQRAEAVPAGTLIITDHPLDPKSKTFEKELMKASKTALPRSGDVWKVFLVAYLKKAAGAPEVNLVFYEIGKGGKREQVNAFPIQTQ